MARKYKAISIFAIISITWVTAAIAGYYVFHHPFDQEFISRAIPVSLEIAASVILLATAGGLGFKLFPLLQFPGLTRLAIRAAFGLGVLSIGYLFVGSFFGTASWIAWLLVVALVTWVRNEIIQWARDFASARDFWINSDSFGKLVGFLSAAIFILALGRALALPLKFDSLMYHLTLPKIYVSAGRFGYVPDIMTWGYPQLPHLLATWVLALRGSTGALIGWFMGLLCVAGIAGHLHMRVGLRGAWVGVAVLLSGYSLASSLGWGYVDWPTLLMGWAMIFYLDKWLEVGDGRSSLIAGAFAGLGFGTKYTAGILAILGGLVLVLSSRRDLKAFVGFMAMAFGFAFPWLLKNFIYTANPFYPLIFPSGAMDELRISYFQDFAVQGDWFEAILLPFRATWFGIEGGRILSAPGFEGSIGPLLLAFAPLAAFSLKLPARHLSLRKVAAVLSLGGLLFWAVGARLSGQLVRTHFYYSFFPALAILAVYGYLVLTKIHLPNIDLGRVAGILVCLVLILNVLTLSIETIDSRALPFLTGRISRQEFLETNLGMHAIVARYMREELSEAARVVMLWEPRAYYCLPTCEPDEVIDRWQHDLAIYGSPESVFDAWRDQGFTHVLYNRLAAQFVSLDAEHFHPIDLTVLEDSLSQLQQVRDFRGDYLLYQLGQ